ncbi:MAG: molybdopterin molybdotransferase MoeA, partial [Sporomusaceae bacterium]|nr:molybdopterin molybdotransferase MoeA [Sporomusaceae bacterium]
MDFFQCISLSKAQQLIVEALAGIAVHCETVHLSNALGRVLAADVIAKEDLPSFSRSTVDGFAVRSADTFGASESSPALFTIVGEVMMGKEARIELQPGQAAVIPTGGMLPAGADAVVMLEYTEKYDVSDVMVLKMVAPGENLVAKGDDIATGVMIAKQGQKLAPQHIGALAACGFAHISVSKRVEVAILSTGDELVDIHEPLESGQIRDVNSYALGAMLSEVGCVVKPMGIVKDSFQQFYDALSA